MMRDTEIKSAGLLWLKQQPESSFYASHTENY